MKGLIQVIGRSNERKRIDDSVASHDIRTVVLYGPKYVGKSLLLDNLVEQWTEDAKYRVIHLDLDTLGRLASEESSQTPLNQLAALTVSELQIAAPEQDGLSARGDDINFWQDVCSTLTENEKLLIVLDSIHFPLQIANANDTANDTIKENASATTSSVKNGQPLAPVFQTESAFKPTVTLSRQDQDDVNGTLAQNNDVQEAEDTPSGENNSKLPTATNDEAAHDEATPDEATPDDEKGQTDTPSADTHHKLLSQLPQLLQFPQIKLVLGADCIEPNAVTKHFTDYLHQTRTIRISPFSKDDTDKVLLAENMEGLISWEDSSAHERVWSLTNGHPAFVAAISSAVSDGIFQDIGDLNRAKPITTSMVDSSVPQALDKVDLVAQWYWESLAPNEQLILSIIAYVEPESITPDAISVVLNDIELTLIGWQSSGKNPEYETRLTDIDLSEVLKKLQDMNLIDQAEGGYRLRIRLMSDWIVDNHQLPEGYIGIIQKASKKAITLRALRSANGFSSYKAKPPRRWMGAKIAAAIVALLAIGAALFFQITGFDSGIESITSAVPRMVQMAQNQLGVAIGTTDTDPASDAGEKAVAPEPTQGNPVAQDSTESANTNDDSQSIANKPSDASSGDTGTDSPETGDTATVAAQDGSNTGESEVGGDAGETTADEAESSEASLGEAKAGVEVDQEPSSTNSSPTNSSAGGESQSPTEGNTTEGEPAETFTLFRELDLKEMIWSVAINAEEQAVAAGLENGSVIVSALSDSGTPELPVELRGHTEEVLAVAFNPQQPTILASASADATILIWDSESGEILHRLQEHTDEVSTLAFTADGSILASGSADKTIRLWDTETWTQIAALGGENEWVLSVAFAPDGSQLASGTLDGTIQLWDVVGLTKLDTLEAHKDWISSVAFSPTADQIASASYDDNVFLWDLGEGHSAPPTEDDQGLPTGVVNSVAFHPSGQFLAGAQHDGSLLVWDLNNPDNLSHLTGHADAIRSVAFSSLGGFMATGALDGMVRLWQVNVE